MKDRYLFKAKRIDNGEWVEGFYFCMTHDDGRHTHHFILPLGVDLSLGTPIEKIQVEIDVNTICQFTGLYDGTKWEDLTEEEKQTFYEEVCSEDGKSIKYQNVEDVKQLWKGKKIWENDVVAFKHEKFDFDDELEFWIGTSLPNKKEYKRNYAVEFCNTPTHYGLRFRNGSIWFMVHRMTVVTHDVEVIGTKFDNPELLGG